MRIGITSTTSNEILTTAYRCPCDQLWFRSESRPVVCVNQVTDVLMEDGATRYVPWHIFARRH